MAQQARIVVSLIQEYQERGVQVSEIAVLHRWRQGLDEIARAMDNHVEYTLDKHRSYDRTMNTIRWLEDLAYWCLSG
jgi:ATP-dependent exoDNAse (exonuclease V) beta subunit